MLANTANRLTDPLGEGDFAALMELYEANYIYLRRLVPQLDGQRDAQLSQIERGPDLHLSVTERCPYTTTLMLTHTFDGTAGAEALPDLMVRIYHDARVAEVVAESWPGRQHSGRGEGPAEMAKAKSQLHRRWSMNRFLNRWLRYCLREGHGFDSDGEFAGGVVDRPDARRWAV
jgi:hypothetical protein